MKRVGAAAVWGAWMIAQAACSARTPMATRAVVAVDDSNDTPGGSPTGDDNTVPSGPKAAAPLGAGPQVVATLLPRWTWTSGGGGNGTYRVSVDGPGAAPQQVTGTSFIAPQLLRAGPHALYVREGNSDGVWGEVLTLNLTVVAADPALDTAAAGACAIDGNGLRCFGSVSDGHGHVTPLATPLSTTATPVALGTARATTIRLSRDAAAAQACALLDSGGVTCWGAGEPNQITAPGLDPNLVGVVDLTTSQFATTLQIADGSLRLYTHGSPATFVGAYNLPGGGRPLSVSGGTTTCTLADTGEVWCWKGFAGSQATAMAGVGALADLGNANPVALGDDGTATLMVSAGGPHVCGIMDDNTLRCTDGTAVTTVNLPGGHWPAAFSLTSEGGAVLLDDDSVGTFTFDGAFTAAGTPFAAGHHGVAIGARAGAAFCVRQDDGAVLCP